MAIRAFRLAALAAAVCLIFVAGRWSQVGELSPAVTLTEARRIFPRASRLGPRDPVRNGHSVLAADGSPLGFVLKTSPETNDLIGYAGPSDLLIGLGPAGRVKKVELISSRDTAAHVAQVRRNRGFWRQLEGWLPDAESMPHVDAVSGSTLTSLAMAESVQRRLTGKNLSLRFPQPVTLSEVRDLFPAATSVETLVPRAGWHRALGDDGTTLGFVVRTSPLADNVVGYGGPTEALVAVAVDQKHVLSVQLRSSYDTPEYVERVREDRSYLQLLAGRSIQQWASIDFQSAGIEGVSGATQTSFALAEGIRRRFQAESVLRPPQSPEGMLGRPRDWGLLALVFGGLIIAFSPLRGNRRVRCAWQALLIAGFGLWFGDLLSLSLLAGWARHGLPWRTAPALIVLTAVALLVPWGTRRQVYCHHLCPHGAAQEWLGRFRRLHVRLPMGVRRCLKNVPVVLLSVAFLLAVTVVRFDLSQLEPFDAWVLKGAAAASLLVAAVGLAASVFVPQAYCRFGCPTGTLLKFLRSHGSAERFGRRDWLALGVLAAGGMFVFARSPGGPSPTRFSASAQASMVLQGEAFGTTWMVKLREELPDAEQLRDSISAELEQIESRLSHWRPESETSQFNSSSTTLELDCSSELVSLIELAQRLSESTDGAFDITIGPLVDAWGYGPSGPREREPTREELDKLLQKTGWRQLEANTAFRSLRKKHPELQLDLGALLQGYAVDRVASILDLAGVPEYLIEVGGELRARGTWKVAIEDPGGSGRSLRTFELRDAALATSGVYRKAPTDDATNARHIISPKTGQPVTPHWRLCAVINPTCVEADGWATALLATDPAVTLEIANREHIAALLVDNAGAVVTSQGVSGEVGGQW